MSIISNVGMFGLNESIRASKLPMSTDPNSLGIEITNTVRNLANAPSGSGEDNFLKGIVVQFDLTMTPKMSVELERYHFIDFVSSQSTQHRITKFDLDSSYIKYVDSRMVSIMKEKVSEYELVSAELDRNDDLDKRTILKEKMDELYLEILYSNPCGFLLTSRMTTNYLQLKTIYKQRRHHRLPEWQEFCDWCETLPYFMEFCFKNQNV